MKIKRTSYHDSGRVGVEWALCWIRLNCFMERVRLRVTGRKSFADWYSSRSGRQTRLATIPEIAIFHRIHSCFYYLITVARTAKTKHYYYYIPAFRSFTGYILRKMKNIKTVNFTTPLYFSISSITPAVRYRCFFFVLRERKQFP